ncbi:MAG: fused MFS/spermidine synthase [Bifidobacteriaceae bacterium]|nr:fused MFS/spermidine synthase [Bifidobacteriaceae bacterium]
MEDVISTEPFAIDTGEARFVVDGDSVTLYVNGWPSSQWFGSRPGVLEFEYMNWMLAVIEVLWPPSARLRCLHLGAAACALPRAIAFRWPASRHLAVEIDAKLAEAVRAQVSLPRSPVLRLRVDDAAATLRARPPGSQELIIRDVFDSDGRTPADLAGQSAALAAAAALAPEGVYLANCGDQPKLPAAKLEARVLAGAFEYVAVIAEPGQWRGRRRGNAVLVASKRQLSAAQERQLARFLAGGGFPARLMGAAEVRRWSS